MSFGILSERPLVDSFYSTSTQIDYLLVPFEDGCDRDWHSVILLDCWMVESIV